MLLELFKCTFSSKWLLPINLHNPYILLCLIWKLTTCWLICGGVKDISNSEILIIYYVEKCFITLWWYLQLIMDYVWIYKLYVIYQYQVHIELDLAEYSYSEERLLDSSEVVGRQVYAYPHKINSICINQTIHYVICVYYMDGIFPI